MNHAISLGIVLFIAFVLAFIFAAMALYEKPSSCLQAPDLEEEDNVIFKA